MSACLILATSLGAAGTIMVEKVMAASCSTPPVFFGRACWRGYFKNQLDTAGPDVRVGGIPSAVNTVEEFRHMIELDLISGNAHRRTGAEFIIHTMLGHPAGVTKGVSFPEVLEWRDRLRAFSNIGENGSRSSGTSGWIDWFVTWHTPCGTPNTFYQDAHDDVAPYVDSPSNSNCEVAGFMDSFVNIHNSSGGLIYKLRRDCMNPLGALGELPDPQDFTIAGRTTVNGAANVVDVLPGDTLQFRHYVRNNGPDPTNPTPVWWIAQDMPSQNLTGGPASSGTYAAGQEKNVYNENVIVPADAVPDSQICRRVGWDPINGVGARNGRGVPACATVGYDFDLEPRINVTIRDVDGQDVTADGVAEAGYTIEFRYSVNNTGLTQSRPVSCTYRQDTHSGYNTSNPTQGFVPAGATCPPNTVFPRNTTTQIATETLSGGAVATNTTICKALSISPATQDGGTESVQSCIPVVAKPYARVYGGDVSVGEDFGDEDGVCSSNTNASVVGWNRRTAGNYTGASAQYAVYALNAIQDFASALSTTGNGAPAPAGLSFANSVGVSLANGDYGGFFGSAPCIKNYYGERPSGGTSLGASQSVTSLTSGTYVRDGSLTLTQGGGAMEVNPGEEITIYVDGDVFIGGDISYPGSWNVANIPSFRLIAQGNIYIGANVNSLSGLYVAQGDGSEGIIHTCATSMSPVALDGNLYDTCSQSSGHKLTVNGALVAHEVRLLRTDGSLSQSNRNDNPPAGGNVGEVFNFNPALWIQQPQDTSGEAGDYDSVISLPPVL